MGLGKWLGCQSGAGRAGMEEWDWESGVGRVGPGEWGWESGAKIMGL